MQIPSKFLAVLVVGAFALAGLPALISASAHPSGEKRSGHHERMSRCDGASRHGGGMHHRMHKWRGPDRMAKRLNVLETEIGIRANQLDVWRDFTDAMLAMMQRPQRPDRQPGMEGKKAEPFGRAQRFAEMAIARGEAGEDLLKAIEALRGTLTPEQLAKVGDVESRMRPYQHHRPSGPGPEEPERGPDTQDDDGPEAEDHPGRGQDAD